jgi:virginiamycin B lyase
MVATAMLATAFVGLSGPALADIPSEEPIGKITEFRTPHQVPSPFLNRITKGPDGNLWFTEGGAGKIGRMTPNGHFTEFDIPTPGSSPIDIVVGPDKALWFTEFIGQIGRITTSGKITEYPIPGNVSGGVFGITNGRNGSLYFVVNCCGRPDGAIGRIGAKTKRVVLYPVLAGTSPTVGLTTGQDGNIWFPTTNVQCDDPNAPCFERFASGIERMTPGGRVNGYFTIPTPFSDPSRIIPGPDNALWFTEQGAVGGHPAPGQIGKITLDGAITEYTTPSPFSNPAGITVGGDGNLWFTEYSYQNADGTTHGANNVGRLNWRTGKITEFPVPTPFARADGITTGPDGDAYFVETPLRKTGPGGAIGRIEVV